MRQSLEEALEELDCPELMNNPLFKKFVQEKQYVQRFGEKVLTFKYHQGLQVWCVCGVEGLDFPITSWTNNPAIRLKVITGERPNPNVQLTFHLVRFFTQEQAKNELKTYLTDEEWHHCDFETNQIAIRIPHMETQEQFHLLKERVKERFFEQYYSILYISEPIGEQKNIVRVNERLYTLKSIQFIQGLFKELAETLKISSHR